MVVFPAKLISGQVVQMRRVWWNEKVCKWFYMLRVGENSQVLFMGQENRFVRLLNVHCLTLGCGLLVVTGNSWNNFRKLTETINIIKGTTREAKCTGNHSDSVIHGLANSSSVGSLYMFKGWYVVKYEKRRYGCTGTSCAGVAYRRRTWSE